MKKIKPFTNIKKKYWNQTFSTKVLDNYPKVRDDRMAFYDKIKTLDKKVAFELITIQTQIFQSRVSEFKELWGKQDFINHDEYEIYAWMVEFEGCEAMIFSGAGKGTTVEIILDDKMRPKGDVFKFYQKFKKLMESFPVKD